jgi:hypothetical protein
LKTFYRKKGHGSINPCEKVQKVKVGNFQNKIICDEKESNGRKNVRVGAGAERNIYGSATLAETRRKSNDRRSQSRRKNAKHKYFSPYKINKYEQLKILL